MARRRCRPANIRPAAANAVAPPLTRRRQRTPGSQRWSRTAARHVWLLLTPGPIAFLPSKRESSAIASDFGYTKSLRLARTSLGYEEQTWPSRFEFERNHGRSN